MASPSFESGSRIFGIGLSRSGTTSLTEALKTLGYTAIHSPTTLKQIRQHQAATDTTVADNFERLDQYFPGSKFIYTIRSRERWLSSCKQFWEMMQDQFNNSFLLTELHKQLYGSVEFDEAKFSEAYERHSIRVHKFFEFRQNDLLILDMERTENHWIPLCTFLSTNVPDSEFPRTHGMKEIDACLIKILTHFRDEELAAKLSGASLQYLKRLSAEKQSSERSGAVNPAGSLFIKEMTVRTCNHTGSITGTAQILGFDPEYVRQVVHEKKRSASWLRRAQKWIGKEKSS